MTSRDKNMILEALGDLLLGIAIGLSVVALLCLASCSTTKYVPVETVRTEYRDRDVERIVADTVLDTRLVWVKGDTVVDIREKEHIRNIEIHDTCYIERTDTIRVPYPVEKRLPKWQQTKIDYGGEAIVALAIALCISAVWLTKKYLLRKRQNR